MSFDTPSRRAFVAGSVLAVGGGGAYYLTRSDDAQEISPEVHGSEATSELGVELEGKPILGSSEAPIEIYYWTDFQCPYCKQFEEETLPEIVDDHVDTGDVRIVLVPIEFFGEDSRTAAIASRCAWDQVRDDDPDRYWEWHASVMDEQGERNSGWAAADNLVDATRSVSGVDADDLEACLDDRHEEYGSQVDDDTGQAAELGIGSTPTFAVFDPETEASGMLVGDQPPERFDDAIEQIEEA